MATQPPNSIAICGMSCRFASSASLPDFWMRVLGSEPAFSPHPDPSAIRYLDKDSTAFNRIPNLHGAFLGNLWSINQATKDSISIPTTANPEFPLTIELISAAFKNALLTKTPPSERIGVVLGYTPLMDPSTLSWCAHGLMVDELVELVRKCFPHGSVTDFTALSDTLTAALPKYDTRSTTPLFPSSLISYTAEHFDIRGPAFIVNSGAVSSHIACQSAYDALISHRADLMVVGGIRSPITPQLIMPYARLGLLSKSPCMHPYGQNGDGTLLGEGAGILILKRTEDAIRDGNRIYATIRGITSAAEGSVRRTGDSLNLAMHSILNLTQIEPESISLIEGEGYGLNTHDRLEIRAISNIFAGLPSYTIALGSIKGLIGNCGSASGIAGIIKTALAIYHRIIPPSQNAETPLEQLKDTPFYLNRAPIPWINNNSSTKRCACVNALAASGAAASMLLEQYDEEEENG